MFVFFQRKRILKIPIPSVFLWNVDDIERGAEPTPRMAGTVEQVPFRGFQRKREQTA